VGESGPEDEGLTQPCAGSICQGFFSHRLT